MKKNYIVIPAGKILGTLTILEGLAASILVDKAVSGVECNKVVKAVGRSAISSLITTPFAAMGASMMFNEDFDIKINLKKKSKDPLKKTRKRFAKAMKLWENVFNTAIEMEQWYNNNDDIAPFDISFKDIVKIDELMFKVTKKLDIEYTPILINIPCEDDESFGIISQADMMNYILAASESVTDSMFKCHLTLNPDSEINDESKDDPISKVESESVTDNKVVEPTETAPALSVINKKDDLKHSKFINKFKQNMLASEITINNGDIELAVKSLESMLNDDPEIIKIVNLYEQGKLKFDKAYDLIIAYLHNNDIDDGTN